ncbi:MAG: NTP transferase domain-containing protein [Candidatus Omnitrophica bacterium]|nr:NTP transferase domain-containing protein [Candidatus Omnitrophota bacterium]MBU2250976.1 NTP transferase domain-containing protein [Candidatus Omnitrophota bacterium]
MSDLTNIDVVILCGGKGERLQSVLADKPKVLADINGKPFLDLLITNLKRFSFKRFILSVGYKREEVIEYFKDREDIVFSEEESALGTGGGLKKAEKLVTSDLFLAINGDSFCDLDFNKVFNFHQSKKAFTTLVLVKARESGDCGIVTLDDFGQIKDFSERADSQKQGFMNAGIYFMEKTIFSYMPKGIFSLEYDLFPKLKNKNCFGYVTEQQLVDIGTPERYEQAKKSLVVKN